MEEITLKAYAKINLSLEVTGRRADGYHDIRSLMQGIDLHDVIKLTNCLKNGTKYTIPHCIAGDVVVYLCTDAKTIPVDRSNLAIRGIEAVLNACEHRGTSELMVSIDKKLPVAAGIAGGSGNAAASMLGLDALLGYPLSLRELMAIGARVGADVPFSLMMNAARNADTLAELAGIEEASTAAWMSGIGDIVEPAEPLPRYVIMANPGISVSTREAYEAIDKLRAETPADDQAKLFVNDLERYTLEFYPEAAALKSLMQEELNADEVLMSGSGPTIAAYYSDQELAASDYNKLSDLTGKDPAVRVWLTSTGIH